MGKTLQELMAVLPPARRARIHVRAAELIAEEKSLRELREARRLTQIHMASKLGVKQHSISRLEQRSDMLLSTLRDYVSQLGGQLILTAQFPDSGPIQLVGIGDIGEPAGKQANARNTQLSGTRERSMSQVRGVRVAKSKRGSKRVRRAG